MINDQSNIGNSEAIQTQDQSTSAPSEVNADSQAAGIEANAPAIAPVAEEKTLRQSEVDKLVGRIKHETYEKALKDAQQLKTSQFQHMQQQAQQPSYQHQSSQLPQGGDDIRVQIQAETRNAALALAQEALANQIVNEFSQKMVAGKSKYNDFDETVSQLNLPNVPQLVQWANGLDNTADVMYEIAKHPSKFANLQILAHTAPHLAVSELNSISKSIKANEEALKRPVAPEPLSQLKPSTTGTDSGSMSIADLKRQPWLRG